MSNIISEKARQRRTYWVCEIQKLSGSFADDYERLEQELAEEIKTEGIMAILDHIRLCGNIPEQYGHDTSEEKLYSKYTDALLSLSFKTLGLKSLVLKERADAADVEAFAQGYSFVADAKAFRLSRTAKNQKDFKIQAMDGWKRGKPFAMVVCPIYQLPNTSSQIYQQATTRNVCIFTYSHLALLLAYSEKAGQQESERLLLRIFETIPALNPSKNALDYWLTINRTMLAFSGDILPFWNREKVAVTEAIAVAKEEALHFLAEEREYIVRLSHEEAIKELLGVHKIDSRIKTISSIRENNLFSLS